MKTISRSLVILVVVNLLGGCFDEIREPDCSAAACTGADADAGRDDAEGSRDTSRDEGPGEDSSVGAECNHDGRCSTGESHDSCPNECAPCGDDVCSLGEFACESDCGGVRQGDAVVFFNALEVGVEFWLDEQFAVKLPPGEASQPFSLPEGLVAQVRVHEEGSDTPPLGTTERLDFTGTMAVAAFHDAGESIRIAVAAGPVPPLNGRGAARILQLDARLLDASLDGVDVRGVRTAGDISEWLDVCPASELVLTGPGTNTETPLPLASTLAFVFLHPGEGPATATTVVHAVHKETGPRCGDVCCEGDESFEQCLECLCDEDGACEFNEGASCVDCLIEPPTGGPAFSVVNTLDRRLEVLAYFEDPPNDEPVLLAGDMLGRSVIGPFQASVGDAVSIRIRDIADADFRLPSGSEVMRFKAGFVIVETEGAPTILQFQTDGTLPPVSARTSGFAWMHVAQSAGRQGDLRVQFNDEEPVFTELYALPDKYNVYEVRVDNQVFLDSDLDALDVRHELLDVRAGQYYLGVVFDDRNAKPGLLMAPLGTP